MKEHIKNFLNEEQDPKAVEKITSKLNDILMRGEEIGYIGVQKKPAITVFPDSIVLTNKRIIICRPKNLGLSMDFTDYSWSIILATFVKENLLGSEFSFNTNTDLTVSIDYIPKIQARKINTFAKEQLETLKEANAAPKTETFFAEPSVEQHPVVEETAPEAEEIEEVETEEVNDYAEIISPLSQPVVPAYSEPAPVAEEKSSKDKSLSELSKEELFDKLQNYKKLLDNGLILQGEYDAFKKEILAYL
ncbi:PH domain-containing protein [Flavobacterium sp. DG1-102-2]|uniref:PH domain-containing protein n=1 Tax=Flavobacterium sp. DG1-102-2 TaxID=3081663 RepID=UPI00294A0C4F|nr:PH domain-containing protein [Flavobacterium sp. DG1-102-2]MDV6169349.1 PH domain-containing protein [Flavobacterium sp. DG1-102-2]